jgi:predicted metal-binding protein
MPSYFEVISTFSCGQCPGRESGERGKSGEGERGKPGEKHFSFSIFYLSFVIGRDLTDRGFFNDK